MRPEPRVRESGTSHPDWRVDDIVYASTDAFEIGGWLLRPRKGRIARGLVVGHGYGGRDQPDFDLPVEETAVLFPCFRGLSRSSRTGIPSDPQGRLENLRRLDIVLAVGKADPFLENNRRLSGLLDEKSIRHQLHLWDGRAHSPRA